MGMLFCQDNLCVAGAVIHQAIIMRFVINIQYQLYLLNVIIYLRDYELLRLKKSFGKMYSSPRSLHIFVILLKQRQPINSDSRLKVQRVIVLRNFYRNF
jgi:hypothetical protein